MARTAAPPRTCALFSVALLLLLARTAPAFEIPARNASGAEGSMSVAPGELVLAVVIMRHGDRSPQRHAPAYVAGDRASLVGNRFPIDYAQWPVDYGQLTELGMQQTREIGRRLRERYIVSKKGKSRGFLSMDYKHAETHVRSTDVDRTLVSAMNAMLGLYEEAEDEKGSSKHGKRKKLVMQESRPKRVVVPVHTVEYRHDALMDSSSKAHCPVFFQAGQRMLETEFCRGAIMRNTELLEALPALTDRDTAHLSFPQLVDLIASVRDLRVAQRAHGVKQPKNVTRFDDALDDIVARVSIAKWDVPGLGGLVGGRLLRAIGRRMTVMTGLLSGDEEVLLHSREECNSKGRNSDEGGSCPRKFVLYSGHDTTIFDVRSAIGLHAVVGGESGGGVAPYASHLIFELRRKKVKKHSHAASSAADKDASDYQYTVTVLQGSHSAPTDTVAGPFCGGKSSCSMKSFLKYVHARTPDDVDSACGVADDAAAPKTNRARGDRGAGEGWFARFRGTAGIIAGTLLGIAIGYVAGAIAHRSEYEPISSGS